MATEGILKVSWDETPCPDLQSWGEEMAKGTTQLPESRYIVHGGSEEEGNTSQGNPGAS